MRERIHVRHRPRVINILMSLLVVPLLAVAGCGGDDSSSTDKVHVVATTTMLGDVVSEIVRCAGGTVTTLMPPGADPHGFAPSSSAVTTMVKADLVVTNGLDLEEGLEDAIKNADSDGARVFDVAPKLDPIPFGDHDHGHAHASEEPQHAHASEEPKKDNHHHAAGSQDPHFWLDVARMAKASTVIAKELGQIRAAEANTFERCGNQVSQALSGVDAQVRTILDKIPANRRVLITDHAAFGYFAKAYTFRVAGVVIPGGSTLAEPSSAELAKLVQTIKKENVPVIFSNAAKKSGLPATVAAEVGTNITVVDLFIGSVGPKDSGAETYQKMMLTNAQRMAQALAG